MTDAVLIIET